MIKHVFNRNQCTVFRPWQGWTSMSTTGPREGTLRLLPMLSLSTAYLILRPFFRPKRGRVVNGQVSLAADDWELNLEETEFPGSQIGKAQHLSEHTHPHLRLDKTLVSLPQMEPGDQVYCKDPSCCSLPSLLSCKQGIVIWSMLLRPNTSERETHLCSISRLSLSLLESKSLQTLLGKPMIEKRLKRGIPPRPTAELY